MIKVPPFHQEITQRLYLARIFVYVRSLKYASKKLTLLFCIFFCNILSAHTLFFRDPLALSHHSAFESPLLTLRPGASIQLSTSQSPSKLNYKAQGILPLFGKHPSMRLSGWALSASGGTSSAEKLDHLFVPGFHFWEIGLGRAAFWNTGGKQQGYSGFFEFAVRDQIQVNSKTQKSIEKEIDIPFSHHNYFFALRMGVSSHPRGKGLIKQKISSLAPQFIFDLMTDEKIEQLRLKVFSQISLPLGLPFLHLGLRAQWNRLFSDLLKENIDITESIHAGPGVEYIGSHLRAQLFARWDYFLAKSKDHFQSQPTFHFSLHYGF